MSRFNVKSTGTKTTNLAGGEAFKVSIKLELISILLTSFLTDQYYRRGSSTILKLKNLIIKEPLFSAKAAIYARNELGMRSVSHVVAGEVANIVKGAHWTKNFFEKVVYRVDDITEILSYYLNTYGKPIPNSLKKGLAKSFYKFDEYQLAKYKSSKKELSLVDAVNLLHPKPTEKNAEALRKLVKSKLKSFNTWEVELSNAGKSDNVDEAKKEAWIKLIKSGKISYFALLRNLRNVQKQAPEAIEKACELLTNEKLIKKSLVLPFRFQTAINELMKIDSDQRFIIALNKAIDIACSNVPKFEGKACIVLDESGSMNGRPIEIGSLFAAIMLKANNADLIMFSNEARYKTINPMDSVLTIQREIIREVKYGGTNFVAPFRIMNKPYDRIIILSDMQGWIRPAWGGNLPGPAFNKYKEKYGCNPHVYSWDLAGYGTLQFPERRVYCLAGFSEKVFDLMKLLESDRQAMINEIEKVKI